MGGSSLQGTSLVIVTTTSPIFPWNSALMDAAPAELPAVTRPVPLTVATTWFEDDQTESKVTSFSVSSSYLATAVAWTDFPRKMMLFGTETWTEASVGPAGGSGGGIGSTIGSGPTSGGVFLSQALTDKASARTTAVFNANLVANLVIVIVFLPLG